MHTLLPQLFRRITWVLILSFFCSGVAMAAYACPEIATPATAMEMAMNGEPCAGMDTDMPVHCAEYQSGSQLALEHVTSAPALTPVVISFIHPVSSPVLPTGASLAAVRGWAEALPDIGIDPPYLRTQRLRI